MEFINDQARRIIEPVLGTSEKPLKSARDFSEGLRVAVNLLRAEVGTSGFNRCNELTENDPCPTCRILNVTRICELVKADQQIDPSDLMA